MKRSLSQKTRGRWKKGRGGFFPVFVGLALILIFPLQGMNERKTEPFPQFVSVLENFFSLLQKRSDALEAKLIQPDSEEANFILVESSVDSELSMGWLSEEFLKSIFLYYSQDPLGKISEWTKLRPLLYRVELSAESCSELFKKVSTFDSKMDRLVSTMKSLRSSIDSIYKKQMLDPIDALHDREDKALGYAVITSSSQYKKYRESPSYSDVTFGQDFKALSEKTQNLSERLKKIAASLG